MARFRRLILCRTIQKKQLKSTQLMQKSKIRIKERTKHLNEE